MILLRLVTTIFLLAVPQLAQVRPDDRNELKKLPHIDTKEKRIQFYKYLDDAKKRSANEYRSIVQGLVLSAQMTLGRMGYGTRFTGELDSRTKEALQEYQKRRGLPVSGWVDFETLDRLNNDVNMLDAKPVSLPPLFVYVKDWEQGYVVAKGTWVLTGDKMGVPEQSSEITCYRSVDACFESTALVSFINGEPMLHVDTDRYEIERWDEHELVTKPKQFGCTRYVRRFNRSQQLVTGLRSTISTSAECAGIAAGELHMVLKSGFDVYLEEFKTFQANSVSLIQVAPVPALERTTPEDRGRGPF